MVYVRAPERRRQLASAARAVLTRDGVAGTTLRAVAAEADVPLGTLHYVFPSKELMIRAVIEEVRDETVALLGRVDKSVGLELAIRRGLRAFWEQQIVGDPQAPLMRHELFLYAVRTPGLESLARWQMEGYSRIVAEWCQEAANNAGEVCDVPFDVLARAIVGGTLGIAMQYLGDRDQARSLRDVEAVAEMVVRLADVRPAKRSASVRP
jgi:AcrR family transcriptional regulator